MFRLAFEGMIPYHYYEILYVFAIVNVNNLINMVYPNCTKNIALFVYIENTRKSYTHLLLFIIQINLKT